MNVLKKIVIVPLILGTIFSFGTSTYAEEKEELYIPKGFESIKVYSEDDALSSSPLKIVLEQPTVKNFFKENDLEENNYNIQVIENKTSPLQELKSLTTNEVITQYKTDFAVQTVKQNQDDSSDSTGAIRTYGTIYWDRVGGYSGNADPYIKMDKISYRFEIKAGSTPRKIGSKLKYFQQGPTGPYGGNGITQVYSESGFTERKNGDFLNVLVRNNNWQPVAEYLRTSSVGLGLDTTVSTLIASQKVERYTLSMFIVGPANI